MSRSASFTLGAILGGVAVVALFHARVAPVSQTLNSIAEKLYSASPKLPDSITEFSPPVRVPFSAPSRPEQIDPPFPKALRVLSPADISLPHGTVRLQSGTTLLALREVQNGVVTKFANREVFVPTAAFQSPPPLVFPETPVPAPAPGEPNVAGDPPDFSGLARYSPSLVIVSGRDSKDLLVRGSGFIAEIGGRRCLVTNAHVVSGLARMEFRQLNGTVIPAGKLHVAGNVDAATLDLAAPYPALKICKDVNGTVHKGDEVLVFGNSNGMEVATELRGTVLAVGPRRVEIDTKFVRGNSGGPVILVKTGEVIGIATEGEPAPKDAMTKDSPFGVWRRFAHRLDTVNKWETPSFAAFLREAGLVKEFETQSEDLALLLSDLQQGGLLPVNRHNKRAKRLAIAVNEYYEKIVGQSRGPKIVVIPGSSTIVATPFGQVNHSMDARQQLLTRLIFECSADINLKGTELKTGFHKGELDKTKQQRTLLKQAFQELLTQ